MRAVEIILAVPAQRPSAWYFRLEQPAFVARVQATVDRRDQWPFEPLRLGPGPDRRGWEPGSS